MKTRTCEWCGNDVPYGEDETITILRDMEDDMNILGYFCKDCTFKMDNEYADDEADLSELDKVLGRIRFKASENRGHLA